MKRDQAKAIEQIRAMWPEKAAAIEAMLADAAHPDGVRIRVGIRYRLEKFDGAHAPGKEPVEVIEGEDSF